jgi:hypothetical protein
MSSEPLLSFNQRLDYWKVVIFKGFNGWFIVVATALCGAGVFEGVYLKVILAVVSGGKFIEGFIDQEVGRAQQKVKEETQHWVKAQQIMKILILGGLVLFFLTGCLTKGPNAGMINPATGQAYPAYVADTATISNRVAQAQSFIASSAPVNPYAPLMSTGVAAVGAVLTVGSGLLALLKSKQASQAGAIANTLAQGVVKAGAQSVVMDHASNTDLFGAVADHLNDASAFASTAAAPGAPAAGVLLPKT